MMIKGVIKNWSTYDGHSDNRIRGNYYGDATDGEGFAAFESGDVIITSPYERIWIEQGVVFCKTKNSTYILA